MTSNTDYFAAFPYARTDDFVYPDEPQAGCYDMGAPYYADAYPAHNEAFQAVSPLSMYNEPQCAPCYTVSSEEDVPCGSPEPALDDGVVPPTTLTLPMSLLRGMGKEDAEEAGSDDAETKKKKKKKKKKKQQKQVEEKVDPRGNVDYWLMAPSAAECCIVPVDDEPVPYELIAAT